MEKQSQASLGPPVLSCLNQPLKRDIWGGKRHEMRTPPQSNFIHTKCYYVQIMQYNNYCIAAGEQTSQVRYCTTFMRVTCL